MEDGTEEDKEVENGVEPFFLRAEAVEDGADCVGEATADQEGEDTGERGDGA